MKYERIIKTPFGKLTLAFPADAAGFRDITLDGTRVGWAHKVYDGWSSTVNYSDREINIGAIGRNLNLMADKTAKLLQSKIDSQASTVPEAIRRIEAAEAKLQATETRYIETADPDDKLDMMLAVEDLREAKQVRIFIQSQARGIEHG